MTKNESKKDILHKILKDFVCIFQILRFFSEIEAQWKSNLEYFRSRRWGSSLTVCARLTVRSSPHQHGRKFSGARVCRVTFKHLPQPLRSHIRSIGTIGQLFKKNYFPPKNRIVRGVGGVPEIFFGLES
jgi:hypothetical protein